MRHLSLVTICTPLLLLCLISTQVGEAAEAASASKQPQQPPHILFFMLDDVGLKDFSYQGARIPTPYSDQLSSRPGAIRLNRYYVHPVCSPSRLSMLTGKYSHLSGMGSGGVLLGPAPWTISDDTNTIPKALKPYGYYSAAVGKWHLGHNRFSETPVGHKWGFEEFSGIVHGGGGHYSKILFSLGEGYESAYHDYQHAYSNGTWKHDLDGSHSTKTFTNDAIRIIKSHAKRQEGKGASSDPLFAYVSYTAVHTPNQAEPEWLDRCSHLTDTKRREHCALMVGLDDAIKNVTETALKELGNNVIVVVSTDNGGDYHHGAVNEPFRGNKVSGFEGGIRGMGFVADLSEGQQHLGDLSHRTGRREGGYEGLMHIADWLPTFRGIAESAKPMDPANAGPASATDVPLGFGHNMHAALRSGGVSPRTDAVGCLDDKTNFVSYIKGDYKLMVGYFGPDGWSEEEDTEDGRGRELSFHEVIEAAVHDALDWYFQTRDATIMWKEIASLMLRGLFVGMQGGSDLFMADKQLLGDRDSFMHGVLSHDDIPVALYNLAEDPYETNDLTANTSASGAGGPSAADVQAVLDDMIQSFEQHWRERPVQFNSAMTCKTNNRFKQFPVEFCDARLGRTRVPGAPLTYSFMMKDSPASTHSSEEHHYAQAIIGTIDSCQFEFPFIADDDDRVCGHVMPEPINLKLLYKGTVTRMLGPYILCIALCLLVTAGAIIYGVLRCLCCRSKSVRADGLKKKNE